MNDITVVTAFFDIGRSNWHKTIHGIDTPHYVPRPTEQYIQYFEYLSKLNNDMIIFCDESNVDTITEIRKRNCLSHKTKVVSLNFNETVKNVKSHIEYIQRRPEYYKFVNDPRMPEYWNADYVLVNYMKTDFINYAYENVDITTPLVSWLDFGYVRNADTIPNNFKWKGDYDPKKIHYFLRNPIDLGRPIFDIIRTNSVYIMGCPIIGGKDVWLNHKVLNMKSLNSLLSCGLIDDDQTILLMNYRSNPEMFELHNLDVRHEDWSEWNVFTKMKSGEYR